MKNVLLLSLMGAFLLVFYSNCGGPETVGGLSGIDLSSQDSNSLALDSSVGLKLEVEDVFVKDPDDIGFNLGGGCELLEAKSGDVAFKLDTVNGVSVISEKVISNACREKRFSLLALFPANYKFTQEHILTIELRAKDDGGNVIGTTQAQVNVSPL